MLKTILLVIVSVCSLFHSLTCLAEDVSKSPIIAFRFHGGALLSYVDDRLRVFPNGRTELETISPFPYDPSIQNRIGRFEGRVDQKEYLALFAEGSKLFKANSKNNETPADAVVTELSFESDEKPQRSVWVLGSNTQAKVLEDHFYQIKKNSMKKALAALELTCDTHPKVEVRCNIKNIGMGQVRTVDPLGVSNSLFCINNFGQRVPMNLAEEYDPRKMKPKSLLLETKEIYAFRLELKSPCHGRILMKTSDMLINSAYAGHLLGELISNPLEK